MTTVKEEWVARLRSGEYSQGKGYLKREKWDMLMESVVCYCPLGVLGDIYVDRGMATWERTWEPAYGGKGVFQLVAGGESSISLLPTSLMLPYIMVSPHSVLQFMSLGNVIWSLNDRDNWSFDAIADYIEAYYPEEERE